jgi:hydroxylysine kinase
VIDPLQYIPKMLRTEPPPVDQAEAARLARALYGLSGQLEPLSSERDVNFCLRTDIGEAYLLKVTNQWEPRAFTDFQISALTHLERVVPDLPVPRHIPTLSGDAYAPHQSGGRVRLLSYLEGELLYGRPRSRALRRSVGRLAGRLNRALASLDTEYGGPNLLWDLKNADNLVTMLDAIRVPELKTLVADHIENFRQRILPLLTGLRSQAVHSDMNPHNILVSAAGDEVVGILDFGDMVRTPLVCDVAITACYQIDVTDPLTTAADFVSSWHAEYPLEDAEIAILPDLVAMRFVTIITIASWRAARYPENAAYILRNVANAKQGLEALSALPAGKMVTALHGALEAA